MTVLLPPSFQEECHGAIMEHTKKKSKKHITIVLCPKNMVVLWYSDVPDCTTMVLGMLMFTVFISMIFTLYPQSQKNVLIP